MACSCTYMHVEVQDQFDAGPYGMLPFIIAAACVCGAHVHNNKKCKLPREMKICNWPMLFSFNN